MDFEHRRQEHIVALGYALAVATVVLCAQAGVFPGTGEAHSPVGHPYRLSMAAAGGTLAILLGTAAGWAGVRRRSRLAGVAALVGGGMATGVALSFAPFVLYPGDQYPVSFGWLVGGAPLAAAAWLVATLAMSSQETFATVRSGIPRQLHGWGKSVAAGTYMVPFILIPSGVLTAADPLWRTAAPLTAATFLAVAGGSLVWDGGRPYGAPPPGADSSPQRSWRRARAGVVVVGFGLALALHLVAEPGPEPPPPGLALIAGVLAVVTALLRSPSNAHERRHLLPIRLLGRALVAGGATTALLARAVPGVDHPAAAPALLFLAMASAACVLLEAVEFFASGGAGASAPAGARATAPEDARASAPGDAGPPVPSGRRPWLGLGVAGAVAGLAAPWLGWPAALVVLGGLLAFQDGTSSS